MIARENAFGREQCVLHARMQRQWGSQLQKCFGGFQLSNPPDLINLISDVPHHTRSRTISQPLHVDCIYEETKHLRRVYLSADETHRLDRECDTSCFPLWLTSARLACENCMKADIAPFGAFLSFFALFFFGDFEDPPPEPRCGEGVGRAGNVKARNDLSFD